MRKVVRAIVVHDNKLLVLNRKKNGAKFTTLPGGGVEKGESLQDSVKRELDEETCVLAEPEQAVYRETDEDFGEVTYFVCRYVDGVPALKEGTEEHRRTQGGENTYQPVWLDIEKLERVNLLPQKIKSKLIEDIANGWPQSLIELGLTKE